MPPENPGPAHVGPRWPETIEAVLEYALLGSPHDQQSEGFVERWLTPLDLVRGSLADQPPIEDTSWQIAITGVRTMVMRGVEIAGLHDEFDDSMFTDVGLVPDQRDPVQLMLGVRWASTWLSTSVLHHEPPPIFVEQWDTIARQCIRVALYSLLIQPAPVRPP